MYVPTKGASCSLQIKGIYKHVFLPEHHTYKLRLFVLCFFVRHVKLFVFGRLHSGKVRWNCYRICLAHQDVGDP